MELMTGSVHTIDASTPAAYVRDRIGVSVQDKAEEKRGMLDRDRNGFGSGTGFGLSGQTSEHASESSSSIGTPGGSEDEDDAVSSNRSMGLCTLSSLEDSLSIKKGLSNHYKGKSKSFVNLSEVNNLKYVEKTENPLNKKRRLLISSKWSRKSTFYSWQNPKSMPLLPVDEDDDDDDDDDDDRESGQGDFDDPKSSLCSSSDDEDRNKRKFQEMKLFKASPFKCQSCFSLADLQEQHR